MKQSQQVLEWQKEARKEGEVAGQRKLLLEVLKWRFKKRIPARLVGVITGLDDEREITRWAGLAMDVASLDAFRAAVGH